MIEYFGRRDTPVTTSVNTLLARTGSNFRLRSKEGCPVSWGDEVCLYHLVNHTALGMHYVFGIPHSRGMPSAESLARGQHLKELGYDTILVEKRPGSLFHYSGGGFLVLQILLEGLERRPIESIMRPFLDAAGMQHFSLDQRLMGQYKAAVGYLDDGNAVPGAPLMFPPLAAGGHGSE